MKPTVLDPVSNDAELIIASGQPLVEASHAEERHGKSC